MLAESSRDLPGGSVALPARRGATATIRTATDNRRFASVGVAARWLRETELKSVSSAAELPLVLLIEAGAALSRTAGAAIPEARES